MEGEVFVGIDVSKSELEVAILPGEVFGVANDRGGIVTLVERLRELAPVRVVMEAAGGLLPFLPNTVYETVVASQNLVHAKSNLLSRA